MWPMKEWFSCVTFTQLNVILGVMDCVFYSTTLVWLLVLNDVCILENFWRIIYICAIVVSCVHTLDSIILIIGIGMLKHYLIYPWLVGQLIIIVLTIAGPITLIVLDKFPNIGLAIVLTVFWNTYQVFHIVGASSICWKIRKQNNSAPLAVAV